VPLRRVLSRAVLALLVLLGGAVAAIGGVSLGGSGLVAVALAAVVCACLAAGVVRDGATAQPRQEVVDVAWRTAAGTGVALLLLSGCAVLAGGAVTALLFAVAVVAVGVRLALRRIGTEQRRPARTATPLDRADAGWGRALSTAALGREWVRTSHVLAVERAPQARAELVRRREEALDELERRDPVGFARWLAEGATVDSDPAAYVSGRATPGYEAA